jgi:sRNA-binding protein
VTPPKQTAAEKQRARMMAAATRRTEPDAAPAGKSAVRSKPVRITVDLDPEVYRVLTGWTSEAAEALDVPRLTLADAIRAMVRATAGNDKMTAIVVEAIRRERES